jgi:hypothetical protein
MPRRQLDSDTTSGRGCAEGYDRFWHDSDVLACSPNVLYRRKTGSNMLGLNFTAHYPRQTWEAVSIIIKIQSASPARLRPSLTCANAFARLR